MMSKIFGSPENSSKGIALVPDSRVVQQQQGYYPHQRASHVTPEPNRETSGPTTPSPSPSPSTHEFMRVIDDQKRQLAETKDMLERQQAIIKGQQAQMNQQMQAYKGLNQQLQHNQMAQRRQVRPQGVQQAPRQFRPQAPRPQARLQARPQAREDPRPHADRSPPQNQKNRETKESRPVAVHGFELPAGPKRPSELDRYGNYTGPQRDIETQVRKSQVTPAHSNLGIKSNYEGSPAAVRNILLGPDGGFLIRVPPGERKDGDQLVYVDKRSILKAARIVQRKKEELLKNDMAAMDKKVRP